VTAARTFRGPIPWPATVKEAIDALAEIVSSPHYGHMVARLIGSTPDYPQLMAAYWRPAFLAECADLPAEERLAAEKATSTRR